MSKEISSESPSWHLRPSVKLVEGALRGALYDLEKGNVYSINPLAIEVITKRSYNEDFWETLFNLGLAVKTKESLEEQEKIPPEVKLSFVWLELTEKCNLRCIHCYGKFGPATIRNEDRLTFKDWGNIIMQLGENSIKAATIIGGEPDLYREEGNNSYDLLELMRKVGIEKIEYFTNATLLDEKKIQILRDLKVSVALSLYSLDPKTHESITQKKGSFEKTMKAIEILRRNKVPVRIAVIAMKQNEDTLSELIRWLKKEGMLTRMPDIIRPDNTSENSGLIPSMELRKQISLFMRPDFSTSEKSFRRNMYWHNCLAGKLSICPDGKVIPCVFYRRRALGNIKEKSLKEIAESEETQEVWRITKDKIPVCRDCEYRYACNDCRPVSVGNSGNYLAPYSRCTYNPYTGEWGKGLWKENEKGEPEYFPIES
ncbi:MAG: hypothetical protein KatS3mg088_522 [Patescibacteria group bacterium]|nr:MAG: hypothetical protein KatS3mg088_522 [Patescibacteria group bacterium]